MNPVISIEQLEWKPFSVANSRGYELMSNLIGADYTDAYSVDLVRVAPGGYSPVHIDHDNHAFYFLEGTGKVIIAGQTHPVRPGTVVKIPCGAMHSIENTGGEHLLFLTIYDPPRERA